MQEVRDKGEWDSTRVQLTGIGEATIIFKWTGREWEPVLMSAQSAALLSKGINELGLYTLVPLRAPRETRISTQPGSRIGRYGGTGNNLAWASSPVEHPVCSSAFSFHVW